MANCDVANRARLTIATLLPGLRFGWFVLRLADEQLGLELARETALLCVQRDRRRYHLVGECRRTFSKLRDGIRESCHNFVRS